jgi:hypothetical protein
MKLPTRKIRLITQRTPRSILRIAGIIIRTSIPRQPTNSPPETVRIGPPRDLIT